MAISTTKLYDTTGIQLPKGACVVIVRTAWNEQVVDRLEAGCRKVLEAHGLVIKTLTVPGAFEIPFGIKSYWEAWKYKDDRPKAFIALGCVLRGDTPHFEYVCNAVTNGIVQLNGCLPVPSIFGVLTVNTSEQIEERLGGSHGHKGAEAAITAIQMIAFPQQFS